MVEDMGYDVVEADSEKALGLPQQDIGYDLLISYQVMPGMTGMDLIGAARVGGYALPPRNISGSANAHATSGDSRSAGEAFSTGRTDGDVRISAPIHTR